MAPVVQWTLAAGSGGVVSGMGGYCKGSNLRMVYSSFTRGESLPIFESAQVNFRPTEIFRCRRVAHMKFAPSVVEVR